MHSVLASIGGGCSLHTRLLFVKFILVHICWSVLPYHINHSTFGSTVMLIVIFLKTFFSLHILANFKLYMNVLPFSSLSFGECLSILILYTTCFLDRMACCSLNGRIVTLTASFAILVVYMLLGAMVFRAIELPHEITEHKDAKLEV